MENAQKKEAGSPLTSYVGIALLELLRMYQSEPGVDALREGLR